MIRRTVTKWGVCFVAVLLVFGAVLEQDVRAQDSRQDMPPSFGAGKVLTRSSPFNPPTRGAFVADAGTGLDTGCTFNTDPQNPLTISVVVDRYVGPVDANGYLLDPDPLVADGIIPAGVEIIMPAYDVDVNGGPPPEQDGVSFNGESIGVLNGDNNIWLLNSFTVDVSKVKFPASPGASATNVVQIHIDQLSSGSWCTAIDWVALMIPIQPKVALTLTVVGGNKVREIADDVIYKQSFDAGCNVTTDIGPIEDYPFAGTADREVTLHTKIELCPDLGEAPDVEASWQVNGPTPLQTRGVTTWSGLEGDVKLKMLPQVAAADANLEFDIDGQTVSVDRRLYVTLNTPLRTDDCVAATCAPKRAWYKLATEWASRADTEEEVVRSVRQGMYANALGWKYLDNAGPGIWIGLVEATIDNGNCTVFSDVLKNMSAVLGADAGVEDRVRPGTFVTVSKLSLDKSFAMAGPHPSGARDRYVFGMHSLLQKGSTWHDATFDGEYSSTSDFIAWNVIRPLQFETRDGFVWVKTTEGALLRETATPLPAPYNSTWGNELRYIASPTAAPRIASTGEIAQIGQPMDLFNASVSSPSGLGANLTGNVAYSLRDADADGIAEALVADVEVEILVAGTYYLGATLMKNGAVVATRSSWDAMNSLFGKSVTGNPGLHTVQIEFSGEEIFRSNEDGPYDLDLALLSLQTLEDQQMLATPAYTHGQFGELPVALTSMTDQGVDLDADGKFDVLRATVTVTVRTAGTYLLDGALWKGSSTLTGAVAPVQQALAPGANVLTLDFDGRAIRRSGANGPYTMRLTLTETSTLEQVDDVFNTQAYPFGDFELAIVDPTGTLNDQGVDQNSNGLFDVLRVGVGVNVTEAGTYLISGALRNPAGTSVVFVDEEMTLNTGAQTLTLDFPGTLIRDQQIDGPYEIEMVVRDPVTHVERERVTLAQMTGAYLHTAFEMLGGGAITLTGQSTDTGIDTDGDGLFDQLQVEVEVALTTTDSYQWSARLVDANGTEIDFDARSGSRSAGTATITFVFDGEAIGNNGVDGPYFVRGLLMFGQTGPNLVSTDVATTAAYQALQFERSVVPYTLSINSSNPDAGVPVQVTPNDLGGNGNGTTPFDRTFDDGTTVSVTAPALAPNGHRFLHWQHGQDVETDHTLSLDLTADDAVTAVYARLGDASGDDDLTVDDIIQVLFYIVGRQPSISLAADVDGSGSVGIADLRYMLLRIFRRIDCFPIEPGCQAASVAKAFESSSFEWKEPYVDAALGRQVLPLQLSEGQTHAFLVTVRFDAEAVSLEQVRPRLPQGWLSEYHVADGELRLVAVGAEPIAAGEVLGLVFGGEAAAVVEGTIVGLDGVAYELGTARVSEVPAEYTLSQNYPNPFNPSTQIQYTLPEAAEVHLEVFDALGRRVAVLVEGPQQAGKHTVSFDARDLPSGVYVYQIRAGRFEATRRMLLVK